MCVYLGAYVCERGCKDPKFGERSCEERREGEVGWSGEGKRTRKDRTLSVGTLKTYRKLLQGKLSMSGERCKLILTADDVKSTMVSLPGHSERSNCHELRLELSNAGAKFINI